MSISTETGISIMLGQTFRPVNMIKIPYQCSAGPDYFTLTLNSQNILEINAIKNSFKEMTIENNTVKSELFGVLYIKSIDSNVSLEKIINGNSVIQNSELNVYSSIVGKVNLNDIRFGYDTFKANISTMMRYWSWKIKSDLDCLVLSTDDLWEYIYNNLLEILKTTFESFNEINSEYLCFDLSAYINLITVCFSSFTDHIVNLLEFSAKNNIDIFELLTNNENEILSTTLNIDIKLNQLDPTFYINYKNNDMLHQRIDYIIELIRKIFINDLFLSINNETKNYCLLKKFILLNITAKELMGNSYNMINFNNYFLSKIGAVCNLAFIFECMHRIGKDTITKLYLLFAMPQKFISL